MVETIDKLKKSGKFGDFAVPISEKLEFRDATYFLRNDGTFIFSEGYCHFPTQPFHERRIVSHIVFIPQVGVIPDYAKKQLFGQAYENITKGIMNTQPLHMFYPLQLKRYHEVDPSLERSKPAYAKYKALVPVSSMAAYFPHINSMQAIFKRGDAGDEKAFRIKKAIYASAELLGISPDRIGMSGSLSLGTYENPHDLDVVIYGTVREVRRIVDFIYELTAEKEERKVFEFGKHWPLRYWEHVDGEKFMICPFFSYLDLHECPLRDFSCEHLGSASFEGRVCDHTHNAYNPSILMLDEVKMNGKSRADAMRLILYHGGERGDYVEGDRVVGEVAHVLIRTYEGSGDERKEKEEYEALLATNIGEVKKR
jgi:hypothetical protein